MATSTVQAVNKIVVQVLVPRDVPPQDRAGFESAAVEFLFGIDRPRPELNDELKKRGIDLNGLAAASRRQRLGVSPEVEALEFIPSPALARHATAAGISLTSGGSVEIEFEYDQLSKMDYPSNTLFVNLKLPRQAAQKISDELTGDIVRSLFGDCELPRGAQAYLNAHGVDLNEVAQKAGGGIKAGTIPPTTRVGTAAAERLKGGGLDVDQFGKIQVKSVSAL
jgi:hypothetical protein